MKTRRKQRTDSTHVLASIRVLNRLELVGETLRAVLNELAGADPEWQRRMAPPEWYERYAHRVEEHRLPRSKAARALESPYDPEARFRSKAEMSWTGYMVHLQNHVSPMGCV